jgi:hypothetical protein
MKRSERLRFLRGKVLDRMEKLSKLADDEKRDLTESEQQEYNAAKIEVEQFDAQIVEVLAEEKAESEGRNLSEERLEKERQAKARATADLSAITTGARKEERGRASSILTRCRQAGLSAEFAQGLIDDERLTADQASDKIFAEISRLAKEREENPSMNRPTGAPSVSQDKRDKAKKGMLAAMLHRIDPKAYEFKDDLGRDYANFSLLDMAKESLTLLGVNVRGLTRDQVVAAALGNSGATEVFAGMHTTSDFPNLLADVANKRLRQSYEAAPRTFVPFCRRVTAPDFKNINVVQMSDITAFGKVNEHGEFPSATLSDSKETYKLATYGEILRVTRQTVVNDDLRGFDRVAMAYGAAAARLENETVWGVITANAALADTVALFHATHKNLITGAGSALGLAGLGAARAALRKQAAPKGQVLNLIPRYILLPAALEMTGLQIIYPTQLAATGVTGVVIDWIRNLVPIVEPLLDANSASAWYLACDPAQIDTIEYAYLEGQEGVYTEMRNGFDIDGIEIKARLDFAAKAIDYLGLQKNAGS